MSLQPNILCIGAVLWDIIGRAGTVMAHGDDHAGRIRRLPGGVALNAAMMLARFGLKPAVLGAVGDDAEGHELIEAVDALGIHTAGLLRVAGAPTDRYMAIEDAQGLVAAVADAHTLEAAGAAILAPLADGRLARRDAPWRGPAVLDGNLTTELLAELATSPLLDEADLRFVPASPGKALRLRSVMRRPRSTLYVNRIEAALILGQDCATALEAAEWLVKAGAARAIVTDGAAGAAEACPGRAPAALTAPSVEIHRVTGAGDTFLAAHLAAELEGEAPERALAHAITAAADYVAGRDPKIEVKS